MVPTKALIAFFSVIIFLSGCANSESKDVTVETKVKTDKIQSDWKCTSKDDGIGESISCLTQSTNDDGTVWTFNFVCTPDLLTRHSITGVKASFDSVYWKSDSNNNGVAKIRIDSLPIETINYGVKVGRGIVFGDYTKAYTTKDVDRIEVESSWAILSKIANAKKLGFQASDKEGFLESGSFDVAGSVVFAAQFNAKGCRN